MCAAQWVVAQWVVVQRVVGVAVGGWWVVAVGGRVDVGRERDRPLTVDKRSKNVEPANDTSDMSAHRVAPASNIAPISAHF
jgi:hypothetical protein